MDACCGGERNMEQNRVAEGQVAVETSHIWAHAVGSFASGLAVDSKPVIDDVGDKAMPAVFSPAREVVTSQIRLMRQKT